MRFALFSLLHIGAGAVSQLQLQELSNVALNRNGMQSHMAKALNGVLASLIVAKQKNEQVPPSLLTAFGEMVDEFVKDIEDAYDSQHENLQSEITSKYDVMKTWSQYTASNKSGADNIFKTWSACLSDASTDEGDTWTTSKSNLKGATASLYTKMLTRWENSKFSETLSRETLLCSAAECTGKFQDFNRTWQDKMSDLTTNVSNFTSAFNVLNATYKAQADWRDLNVSAKGTARTNLMTKILACKGDQTTLREHMCDAGKYGEAFEKLCKARDEWATEVGNRESDLISQKKSWSVQQTDLCVVNKTFYHIVNQAVDNSHTYDATDEVTTANRSSILKDGTNGGDLDGLVSQWTSECQSVWGADHYEDSVKRSPLENADVTAASETDQCQDPALTVGSPPTFKDWKLFADLLITTETEVKPVDDAASWGIDLLNATIKSAVDTAEDFGDLNNVFIENNNDWSLNGNFELAVCDNVW